jgi:hypothetical protein
MARKKSRYRTDVFNQAWHGIDKFESNMTRALSGSRKRAKRRK